MSSHRLTAAAAIATMAAAISLSPLLDGITWFWAGAGAAVTVAAVGTLTRLRRLPAVVCLAAGVAGLVCYLNLAFEPGQSFGHLLPTLSSLRHLGGLARTGITESDKYAPPAPQLPGMLLLAAGGTGIVALLTDLIAVRLRSVALAGVPLLLLITEPFTVSASRSWIQTLVAFCLGTAGYLGMLGTESRQRIRDWEPPRPGSGGGPDTTALSAAGRRVGAASVVIALCLPLLIPGLHDTRLLGGAPGIGGRGGSGGGGAPGFPSPQTLVSQELHSAAPEPVLSYRDAFPFGPTTPQYLQVYALDQLTDSGWQLTSTPARALTATGALPAPPGLAGSPGSAVAHASLDGPVVESTVHIDSSVQASAQVNNKTVAVLPVPYPALKVVPSSGTWRASTTDLMVYSGDTQVSGLTYSVVSLDEQPAESALEAAGPPPAAIARAYESLPASYRRVGVLQSYATGITAGYKSPFDKALALQKWLGGSGDFSYTLKAPSVTSATQLASFIEVTRKGYCQQFADAMAVLARLIGIPSRVAIGFTSGKAQPDGSYLVTTHDMHEWPELYFSGFGWLRFEPTPTGQAGQGSATMPSYSTLPSIKGAVGSGTPVSLPTTLPSPHSVEHALPPGDVVGAGTPSGLPAARQRAGLTPWEIFGLVVAGLLLAGIAAPALARAAIRRRRWGRALRGGDTDLAHAAWRELRDDLIDYQAGYSPSESPRALGTRLGTRLHAAPGGVGALERITVAEERARYSGRPVPGGRLRRDSAELRRALAATMPRRARWRARVLPLSVLSPTATGVSQAADAVGSFQLRRPRSRRQA